MLQNRKDDTHNHSTNMQPLLMLNLKYEAVHEGWQSWSMYWQESCYSDR
jgi:hypothetical protein